MGLFTSNRNIAEAFPPGEFIKDELQARGWSQSDLADILGRNTGTISQMISGKQPINPTLAKELGAAFGTDPQFWMNLQTSYLLWREEHAETNAVERKARLYALTPVKELVKRNWIEPSENIEVLERRVCSFLGINNPLEAPTVSFAARKSGANSEIPSPPMIAWLKRATYLAEAVHVKKYSEKVLVGGQHRLRSLMQWAEDVKQVPRVLADLGIRFVVVEHMPQTKLDGMTFWLNDSSPVVALTLRHDRVDNFWQSLLHEIDHVRHGEGKLTPCIDEDIESSNKPENELRCDRFAAEFSIPPNELRDFIARVRPYFTPEKATGFALRMKVHPSVAAGQIRHAMGNFSVLSTLVSTKIRPLIFETAVCDGWGHTLTTFKQ
jgi:HTH-type transcriptional regulator / antitoxin HigA